MMDCAGNISSPASKRLVRIIIGFALLAIMLLTGCEGEGGPRGAVGPQEPPGPYSVITVNGDGLFTIQEAIDSRVTNHLVYRRPAA